jgi:hypothetical protein
MFSLPGNCLELFNNFKAGELDTVKDEPQIGWTSRTDILDVFTSPR